MNPVHIATGQLPNTQGTLFTVPSGLRVVVTSILVINESASPDQDVTILLDRSGGALEILHAVLETQHTSYQWNGFLVLDDADEILGEATDATSVNYFIDGYEMPQP